MTTGTTGVAHRRYRPWLLFTLGLVGAPVAVTIAYRLLPSDVWGIDLLPLGVFALAALAIELWRPVLRRLWIGLLVGGVLHIALLAWLFGTMSTLP